MEQVQTSHQAISTGFPMQPQSFPLSPGLQGGGPYILPQRTDKFVNRVPGVLTETKIKDEPNDGIVVRENEMNEFVEHGDFQNMLICTESLQSEEQFHTNENATSVESTSSKGPGHKLNQKQQVQPSNLKRVNKLPVLSTTAVTARDKTGKRSMRTVSPEKRRQSRPRRSVEEPIIREVTLVDEQSVVPLSDVIGDLDFDDLDPEDLDLVRHLPPPGHINIVDRCAASLQRLRDFERKLQDVLHHDSRVSLTEDADHDSDATLSIISEDVPGLTGISLHSAENPATNMSMLMAYKMVFDPPVPAVVTIPTSMVQLSGTDDWKTESNALQYLMKKNVDPKNRPPRASKKRKREEDTTPAASDQDEYLKRLIMAIEIKSNKVVHLKQPFFTLQHPLQEQKKKCLQNPVTLPVEKHLPESAAEKFENSPCDQVARNGGLVRRLDLDSLCEGFLQVSLPLLQPEELLKAVGKKNQLQKLWNQRLSVTDASLQKDLGEIIEESQMRLKELTYGKERAALVADEKYLLDVDETEKRLNSATEKAKSHVISMFEENRRQYELQRTLDYSTCKYDMLSINTRHMRRRADVPSSHARLLEDLPSSSSGNPSGSPPHSAASSSLPLVGSQMRRRRNHFTSVLKDSLEDKEIYDDLANINRVLKEDPQRERTRMLTKSAEVVPDNNRLTVDGKVFHRNQPVMVEHHEHGKYPGTLLQITQTEIVIKRCSDGRVERSRFPVGFLMDRRIILKKRSISLKNNNNGSAR